MTLTTPFPRSKPSERAAGAPGDLRALIAERLASNAASAASHEAIARELAGHTDPDSGIERELAQACAARAWDAVRDGEEALRRLDDGTYGICQACGQPIPQARLEVLPEARRCVACPQDRTGPR